MTRTWRVILARAIFIGALIWSCVACARGAPPAKDLRDGDVVFQTSRSRQSALIQRATHSPWSHMGVIFLRRGEPWVLEASATVRYTRYADWAARGVDGHVVAKRLRESDARLDASGIRKLRAAAERYLGRAYDREFRWSDERLYCSELVWKAYVQAFNLRVGEPAPLASFDFGDAAVRAEASARYGKALPKDEVMISPAAMFDSDLLETVN